MIELLLALFLALSCPAQNHNHPQHGPTTVTTAGDDGGGDDSGGEGEHIPPVPPPHNPGHQG